MELFGKNVKYPTVANFVTLYTRVKIYYLKLPFVFTEVFNFCLDMF